MLKGEKMFPETVRGATGYLLSKKNMMSLRKQIKISIMGSRGGLGSQTGRGKNIKAALSPFSFLFLLCE